MNIHCIAIGASDLQNLAIALKQKGYQISGSDDHIDNLSKSWLQKHHLLPEKYGWFPQKITPVLDVVILGMTVKQDNLEWLKAKALGIKIYSCAEFLYEQSKDKTRVVISGSLGKATITAMILHVLTYHHKAVDYMLETPYEDFKTMAHLTTQNDFIVLEEDENLFLIDKRPKFHFYKPNIALISSVVFKTFIDSITNGGILVYNKEDIVVRQLVEKCERPIKKYPYKTPPYIVDKGVVYLDTAAGKLPLSFSDKHNLQNLAGAKWICQCMGIDEEDFYDAIADFKLPRLL